MNKNSTSSCQSKGCLQIFLMLAVLGYFVEKCEESACEICGSYTFKNIEFDSGLTYVLTVDEPELLKEGITRARVLVGIHASNFADVLMYKGQIIFPLKDTETEGMIRVEYRYNNLLDDWQQITFANDSNILFCELTDEGLILRNGNSGELFLSMLDNDLFVKD
ncbi:MAG: hypothetical protein D6694_11150 [Gammaproteobacteria bacterium]|nr:MAG: hypothetical protein D6694_11150 [Gammaproteobacteria bacterium]